MLAHSRLPVGSSAVPLHPAQSSPCTVVVSVPAGLVASVDVGDATVSSDEGLTLPAESRETFFIPAGDVLHAVSNGEDVTVEVLVTSH